MGREGDSFRFTTRLGGSVVVPTPCGNEARWCSDGRPHAAHDWCQPARGRTWHCRGADSEDPCILVCRECGDGDHAKPLPFESEAERGKWASLHTRQTGHDRWGAFDSLEDMTASRQRDEAAARDAAIFGAAIAALEALPADATRDQMAEALAKVRKDMEQPPDSCA